MKDLMIDLETLGTDPNTPVISIGAVFFDVEKKELGSTFYATLDISEQIERGRKPTGDTIKWWMSQTDAAKKVFSDTAGLTSVVLPLLVKWIKEKGTGKVNVWGNGSTFDISIMEDIFKDYKVKCPWQHFNVMDLRTFKRFVAKGKKVEKKGVNHNALDDAKSQALYVMENL